MVLWIPVRISPGQFTGEVLVEGKEFNGQPFALFVPEEFADYESPLASGQAVDGFLIVKKVAEKGDLVLVLLPRPTLQTGPYVTVKANQLVKRVRKQKV